MNKRTVSLLLILCLLTTMPGCWDQVEVEQLAIVRAIAIDYLPGRKAPYLVTLAISLPSDIAGGEGGGGGQPTQLFSGVGASIQLALEQIRYSLSRRVFLSHAEIIIVGQDLARHGLTHVLDFIIRHPQTRLNTYLIITTGFAQKSLTTSERLESGVTEEILGLITQAELSGETSPQQTFKFMRQMTAPGQDPYTSLLMVGPPLESRISELKDEQTPGGQEEGSGEGNGGGDSGGGSEEQQNIFNLAGLAAFRAEKMAGMMDHLETRGFLWYLGETSRTIITVTDPEDPTANVDLLVARVDTTITPVVKDNKVSFTVEVEEEGDIRSQSAETNLATPEMLAKLNSAKAAAIKIEMEKALRKMQELKTDLVGFGATLNRKNPKVFARLQDQWPEYFSELEVKIVVTANIRRTGQHSRPARPSR